MSTSQTPPSVARIDCCNLSQWQICHINPTLGVRLEVTVKRSIEAAITRAELRGKVRLSDTAEKVHQPDILVDVTGPGQAAHIAIDCRRWTATKARRGRIYLSREFYGTARKRPSLDTFLQDSTRTLFVAFELSLEDSQGHRERRLFLPTGAWLMAQFDSTKGLPIDTIPEIWPGFRKGSDLLYEIPIRVLIGTCGGEHHDA